MNFILFMPDEMRAESAGCYGHPLVRTPNLDRLSAEGTTFEQCHVQHTVCTPSRCSTFTGWYPHVAGHRTLWHLLRPHEPNLLKSLKAAGYDVRWYGKNDLLAEASFAGSVTEATNGGGKGHYGPLVRKGPRDPHHDTFLAEPFPHAPEENSDFALVRRAIDFLRSGPSRPFFIHLPLEYPHPPYSAPQPFHDMYRPEDLPPLRPPGLDGKPIFHRLIRQTRRLDALGEADFRRIAAIYLGMCSYTDWMLGELLRVLDETGRSGDTTVLFTSDHGDWAGDWGLVEKWPSGLDDTLTRVPLVVRAPGGKAGHRVAEPVEAFDVMATVLELAGLKAGHTHFARSLVPQLGGGAGDAGRAVFSEGGYHEHSPHCFEGRASFGRGPEHIYYQKGHLQQTHPRSVCPAVSIRTASHKLVRRSADVGELYDLRADPRELNNLHGRPDAAAVQRELEKRLLDFYLRTADVTPFDEDPRGLPQKTNDQTAPRGMAKQ